MHLAVRLPSGAPAVLEPAFSSEVLNYTAIVPAAAPEVTAEGDSRRREDTFMKNCSSILLGRWCRSFGARGRIPLGGGGPDCCA